MPSFTGPLHRKYNIIRTILEVSNPQALEKPPLLWGVHSDRDINSNALPITVKEGTLYCLPICLMVQEKEKMQRPAGMSREAFALLDGSHPVVPTLTDGKKKGDLQGLKEKRKNPQKGTVSTAHTWHQCSLNATLQMVSQAISDPKIYCV